MCELITPTYYIGRTSTVQAIKFKLRARVSGDRMFNDRKIMGRRGLGLVIELLKEKCDGRTEILRVKLEGVLSSIIFGIQYRLLGMY